MTIDCVVNENLPGLRVPDTNVLMSNSCAIYLLSGNIDLVDGYEEAIKSSKFASSMLEHLEDFRKKPHDILIPHIVRDELDHIKGNHHMSEQQIASAHHAQSAISNLLVSYHSSQLTDEFKIGELLGGLPHIELDNGAKVYFEGITDREVSQLYKYSQKPRNDIKIIMTALQFAKLHGYKNVKLITDDKGAQADSIIQGLPTEPFLFEEVRNPLQLYTGLVKRDVNYNNFKRLMRSTEINLNDEKGLRISPKNLEHNQIVQFRNRNRKPGNGKYKSHFMVHDPNTNSLRNLKHYNKFIDFYNNFKVIQTPKNPNRLDAKTAEAILKILQDKKLISNNQYEGYRQEFQTKTKSSDVRKLHIRFRKRILNKHRQSLPAKYHIYLNDPKKDIASGILEVPFSSEYIPRGQQLPFLDHILNPDIKVVSIDAGGGFGKTLWPIAAGLYMLHKGMYQKMVYAASQEVAETGVGFLPGNYEQKIMQKVRPAYDSIHKIFGDNTLMDSNIKNYIDRLKLKGRLEITVISDWKGRTFDNSIGIIDEAHFFSRDMLGLALGRFGKESKVIVMSDLYQKNQNRRNLKIDPSRTGIAHMTELLREFPDYAHITADKEEIHRGRIPEMAGRLTGRDYDIRNKVLKYQNGKR